MLRPRLLPWTVRAVWAVLPFTMGPALEAVLDLRSRPVQLVAAVGLWGGWAATLVAALVPSAVSLTVLRTAAPAAVAAVVAATVDGHPSALAASTAALALAVAFLPETGNLFVNGAAYPNERRFPLRAPAPLLLGVLPVTWALCVLPPVVGALLLAAGQWAGLALAAVAAPLSVVLARALHGLSRRWLVFVPAGVVLHDPIGLADPVLFQRKVIASLGPARVGTDALDLTQRAPGLALELTLKEEVPLVRLKAGDRRGEPASSIRLLFTPTRPGAVLQEAAARRLPAPRA